MFQIVDPIIVDLYLVSMDVISCSQTVSSLEEAGKQPTKTFKKKAGLLSRRFEKAHLKAIEKLGSKELVDFQLDSFNSKKGVS